MSDNENLSPQEWLRRYAAGPDELEATLAGLAPADLDKALDDASWSIRQIIHHLADGDDLWKTCIKAAVGESSELFSYGWYWGIPQDSWAERWAYADRSIEQSLALFRANRRHIVQLLNHVPDSWERCTTITLPDGETRQTSVGYVLRMQVNHLVGHIEDIQAIREKQGV